MTEDELIKQFFSSTSQSADVVLGIGDDGAVVDIPKGYQLVTSVDTLLEGVHFPENYPPEHLASRAVAVCVSDLAAMGAEPKWLTLALTIPQNNTDWLSEFSTSFLNNCSSYGMHLIGGDTVKGKLSISINVMGIVESGKALRRDQAQIDDKLYVSGSLGGAAFALSKVLENQNSDDASLIRFNKPAARIKLGRALIGIASSCMDVSDGVLLDASRLVKASGVGVNIKLDKLPLHECLVNLNFEQALGFASAGDDYELLFTVPQHKELELKAVAKRLSLPLHCIGDVVDSKGVSCTYLNEPYSVNTQGYQHFN